MLAQGGTGKQKRPRLRWSPKKSGFTIWRRLQGGLNGLFGASGNGNAMFVIPDGFKAYAKFLSKLRLGKAQLNPAFRHWGGSGSGRSGFAGGYMGCGSWEILAGHGLLSGAFLGAINVMFLRRGEGFAAGGADAGSSFRHLSIGFAPGFASFLGDFFFVFMMNFEAFFSGELLCAIRAVKLSAAPDLIGLTTDSALGHGADSAAFSAGAAVFGTLPNLSLFDDSAIRAAKGCGVTWEHDAAIHALLLLRDLLVYVDLSQLSVGGLHIVGEGFYAACVRAIMLPLAGKGFAEKFTDTHGRTLLINFIG